MTQDPVTPDPTTRPGAVGTQSRFSLWSVRGYLATLIALACAFGAWSLLLPLLPTAVISGGGSATLAGATTGVFMLATVATQAVTPRLLRAFGYRPVMAAAAFTLGVPALGHMLGIEPVVALGFSALRGVGFGALTVSQSAFIAEIVPLRFLGQATGVMGFFIGAAQMICLPAGLAIAQRWDYGAAYIVAATLGGVGMVLCLRLPALRPAASAASAAHEEAVQVRTEGRTTHGAERPYFWRLVLVPALSVTALSMSYGVISAFLPAAVRGIDVERGVVLGGAMLGIVGGASMMSRYVAGRIADRSGRPGQLMGPGLAVGIGGMALLAAGLSLGWSVWTLVGGAIVFGLAFGVVQNEALLAMFARVQRGQLSEASAVWNSFYDGGTGIGSVILAAFVTGTATADYAKAFWAGAALVAGGLAMALLDAYLGAHRVVERDNMKTRLSRLRKV